ncbi:hypothetical protein [Kluyvera ascorbata]|uniref:hypothetical protein n=1 Tax=Kluyvera ascorbata TaxID=51288 RepID=UPI00242CC520|nr:hypothetical protein [Kluyvera ascorbata]
MSLTLLASNNASTVLASSINASATTLTVNTGAGSLFPSPVSGTSFFKLTLVDAATGQLTEIVHVTARTGDVMTIERAQEGTAARVWSANDIAANMMTAGTLSYILGSFQPLDATLTALAALIGAADKLPYFNGPDTATLTALTGVGRDIIGKTTVAEILSYLGLGGMGQTYSAFQDNSSTTTLTASFTMTPPSDGVLFVNSQFLINNYTTAALWTPSATGGTVKNVTGQYNSVGSGAFAVSVTKGTSVTVSSRINQATAGAMKSSMTAIFVPTVG